MPFIKSHSNYVLKKKHQDISDGTIYERDITTIGGLNQFAKGQVPIYRSSNFIITVNAAPTPTKDGGGTKWVGNDDGDVWNLSNLSGMVIDDKTQDDTAVVLKQDYYDFTDFAYFGSLVELFRVSLSRIIRTFPGELYSYEDYPYLWHDGDRLNPNEHVLGLGCDETDEGQKENDGAYKKKYRLDNPYKINIHSLSRPVDGEELKYFADGGYKNYQIVTEEEDGEGEPQDIECWVSKPFLHKFEGIECLNREYGDYVWYTGGLIKYGYGETSSSTIIGSIRDIISDYATDRGITEEQYEELEQNFFSGAARDIYDAFDDALSNRKWFQNGTTIESAFTKSEFNQYIEDSENIDEESGEKYIEYNGVRYFKTDYNKLEEYGVCDSLGCFIDGVCIGDKFADIVITTSGATYKIGAWWGENWEIKYLPEGEQNYHIRPKKEFMQKFYNGLNNFERLFVSNKTTPKYKAWFSVVSENDYGYTRKLESFVFPTGPGGYNLDYSGTNYGLYVGRLSKIGNFYDERFCDNIWRNLTHEAIHNFDWTFTRDYSEGDEIDFILGGERMRKLIRIYGRELDEVKMFADSLKSTNTITYNGRGNTPDYFLTDLLEQDGWDVVSPIPFSLSEKYLDDESKWVVNKQYEEDEQLNNLINEKYQLYRIFSQNASSVVYPYRNDNFEYQYGYFIDGYKTGDNVEPPYQNIIPATSVTDTVKVTNCGVRYRICDFYDNSRFYTFFDMMNEFFRRLKINSRYLWRKKGTIEGLESILALFGLKSKRWVDSITIDAVKESLSGKVDYDTQEYTSFTTRIEEEWDPTYEMYKIDRVNSTKQIKYDYRSIPNETIKEMNWYFPYQGLGVVARYADEGDGDEIYLSANGKTPTSDTKQAARYTTPSLTHDNYVRRRFLYPTNSPVFAVDGNPYFQMDGGWRATTIWNSGVTEAYNISLDNDDNFVWNKKEMSPHANDDAIYDDRPIYKETVRDIRNVTGIRDLLSIPYMQLHDGSIVHVRFVENNIAIIDGKIYDVQYEYYQPANGDSKVYKYISLLCQGKSVAIGDANIYDILYAYDRDGNETLYDLTNKPNGFEIKAYITDDGKFVCHGGLNGLSTITSFGLYNDKNTEGYTNYFVLDDVEYFDRLKPIVDETSGSGTDGTNDDETNEVTNPDNIYGWRRLKQSDYEYHKVQLLRNYFKGNNPHNGNMVYDSGHEYFMHFKELFKYPIDNDLFDARCYNDLYAEIENTIKDYGFTGLVDENEEIKSYDNFMTKDNKIHYFGNYKKRPEQQTQAESDEQETSSDVPEPNVKEIYIYTQNPIVLSGYITVYQAAYSGGGVTVSMYMFNENEKMVLGIDKSGKTIYDTTYTGKTGETVDNVTNQILNNKRFDLKLNMHSGGTGDGIWGQNWYSNDGQTEFKYLEDVVMHYTEQMIPSTAIWDVKYIAQDGKLNQCS